MNRKDEGKSPLASAVLDDLGLEESSQDPRLHQAPVAATKDEILTHLQQISEGLASGYLGISLYHQDLKTGRSEVSLVLKGDYLGTSWHAYLVFTQDWTTTPR